MPLVDLEGGFFDAPFPSDARVTASGGPDLSDFPNPTSNPLLDEYIAVAGELDGAGTSSTITFRFDGPLDLDALPAPGKTLARGAPVFLLDVDPRSPSRGTRIPLIWDFQEEATTYQAANLLTLAPLHGVPLRHDTTYVAVITTELASQHPFFAEVWSADHPDHAAWQAVQDGLFELGVSVGDVAVATVFTTQDPLRETGEWAWRARHALPVPTWDQALTARDANGYYQVWEGQLEVPLWQHGERPYLSDGGAFQRDAEGEPAIAVWEDVAFSLAWPAEGDPPETGWPVVLYAHGTGGDHRTCCDSGSGLEPAAMLAKAGFATLGIAQPLHGDRATPDTDSDFHTFNYLNPDSVLHNFRQGALDHVYMAMALRGRSHTFDADGTAVSLDPEEVTFLGHSQGGISGALAAPFLGGLVDAAALSGAGGGLSYTLVHRKDGMDIAAMIADLLDLGYDEELDELHPITGLVQLLSEVTDPLNYARHWFLEDHLYAEGSVHVMATEGLLDEQTPSMTTEAMAAAGGLPILEPVAHLDDAHLLMGPPTEDLATTGNAVGYDGRPITAGLGQYPDDDHYAIFDNSTAARLYQGFLATARDDGTPTLGSD